MTYEDKQFYLKEALSNMNIRINTILESKELPLHSKIRAIKTILIEYAKEVEYYNQ